MSHLFFNEFPIRTESLLIRGTFGMIAIDADYLFKQIFNIIIFEY